MNRPIAVFGFVLAFYVAKADVLSRFGPIAAHKTGIKLADCTVPAGLCTRADLRKRA
jgi:hypothetical protein